MANGQMTELQKVIAVCGECRYTGQEIMDDYPVGTGPSAVEATGTVVHGVESIHLLITPHRSTCSQHTSQRGVR